MVVGGVLGITDNRQSFLSRISENLWVAVVMCVGLLSADGVVAAEINVTSDRNPVQINESFNLVFQAIGSPDSDPDFGPLQKDFEILSRGQSSNISIVNGAYDKTIQWKLNVIAKRTGKLMVPSISFGKDVSLPIIVSVNEAQSSQLVPGQPMPELLLEIEAQPENPYVQAQVIYTVRLLHRVNISEAQLTEPKVENAIVEKLGEDVSYNTRRQGNQYSVVERKYAIFPQKSGVMMVEPLELNAQVITSRRRGSSFDNFFSRGNTRTKRIRSKLLALKVKPIPAEFVGKDWLPAEQILLTEDWPQNPPKLTVGEPITRTLILQAKGLPASQIPEINNANLSVVSPNGGVVKQYADQPNVKEQKTRQGLVSSREEKTALIPSSEGEYVLPTIEIPWWNTETDRMEVARIPELIVGTLASTSEFNTPIESPPAIGVPSENQQVGEISFTKVRERGLFWEWISLVLALGWLGTLIVWGLKNRKKLPQENLEKHSSPNNRRAVRSLKRSCYDNDSQAAKDALLQWAGAIWPESPPNSLGDIERRCSGTLKSELKTLNQSLYGIEENAWHGQALWVAFFQHQKERAVPKDNGKIGLEPLYKL